MVVPPIAIYGAIATSKALAQELYEIIKDACKSRKDLEKLRDTFVYSKLNFDAVVDTLKEIGNNLKPELGNFVTRMTGNLAVKFTEVKAELEAYGRARLPLIQWHFVKDALTQAIEALSEWTDRFLQLYAMLPLKLQVKFQERLVSDKFRAGTDGILDKLKTHINVKKAQLDFDREHVENALATMSEEPPERRRQDVRVFRFKKDIITIPAHIQENPEELRSFKLEVARLYAVLRAADPEMTHLPKAFCWFQRRAISDPVPRSFGIAYKIYENLVELQVSLKEVIKMGPPQHPLNDRIKLAQDFVSAMTYLRGLQWVHKAIRSTNVLLCYNKNDKLPPEKLGHVNLVGFNVARRGTGDLDSWNSAAENAKDWRDQVYCHPERQTVNMIIEDIKAFEDRKAAEETIDGTSSPRASRPLTTDVIHVAATAATDSVSAVSAPSAQLPYYRYMHDIYSIGVVLLEIGLWRDLTPENSPLRTAEPQDRQRELLRMTRGELPRILGSKYASIVRACLEAEDEKPLAIDVLSGLVQIQI